MKKPYEKPAMRVVQMHHQPHLLQSTARSVQTKFVNDEDDNWEWDSDGAQ